MPADLPEGEDMDYTCLALDSVDAGEGDIVVIAQEGWSASTAATGRPGAAMISAIVRGGAIILIFFEDGFFQWIVLS